VSPKSIKHDTIISLNIFIVARSQLLALFDNVCSTEEHVFVVALPQDIMKRVGLLVGVLLLFDVTVHWSCNAERKCEVYEHQVQVPNFARFAQQKENYWHRRDSSSSD